MHDDIQDLPLQYWQSAPRGETADVTLAGKSWQPSHEFPHGRGGRFPPRYWKLSVWKRVGREAKRTKMPMLEIDFSTQLEDALCNNKVICHPSQIPKKHGIQVHVTLLCLITM